MSAARDIAGCFEARAAAIAALDAERLMEQIADDIVSFDIGMPLVNEGSSAVRERLEAWFAGYEGPIEFLVRDLTVHGGGDVAFSHALVHVGGRLRSGDTVSMWVRLTSGWQRRSGSWLLVHEHMSDPMDFDTGMVRTDLRPM